MLFILLCVWPTEALSVLQQNVGLNCYKMRTVSALSMAALPHFDRRTSPRQLVADGMIAFRQGKIQESIDLFDRADHAVPDGSLRPYLWQRGISYYYNDEFDKGSHQFRSDVAVNPLDVEEIVWDIACLSRLDPAHVPPSNMLSLPKGAKDRRRIMSTVYSLFRGEATEHDLAIAGHSGSKAEEFYALFYLGLFCESRGETSKAESYMKAAAATDYSNGSGDYMTDCARVHCKLREWL
jgi:tetratricopeptide (TPR) repeat protein